MREMHWSWQDYLDAPVSLVRFIVEMLEERATVEARQDRKRKQR